MKISIQLFAVVLIISLWAGNSGAAEGAGITVYQRSKVIGESDIKSQAGKFSQTEFDCGASKEIILFDRMPVGNTVGLKHIVLHNGSALDLPDSLQAKGLFTRFYIPDMITGRDNVFLGIDLAPSYNTADSHGFDQDAFRLNYGLSLIYRRSSDCIFVLGTMFRPDYQTETVSFAGFRYRVNDRWNVDFLSLNPNVSYKINDRSKILLEFDIMSDEFEVLEGSRKGQVLSAYGFGAGIGYEHKLSENYRAKISLGSTFARKFEYYYNGSKTGDKIVPKNAFYAGYNITCNF